MDKIREIVSNNKSLIADISSHPILGDNLIGILKNIEAVIPDDCRQNFYKNLEVLRILPSKQSMCSLQAPVICVDEKMLWLADNNKASNNINFSDALVEELYHELLHLSSTSYIVDLDSENVNGFSGFAFNLLDLNVSNNILNGLTEGFTQYLTSINNNSNFANYDIQIECAKKLIDTVGIDAVKQSYFNNELGMGPIINKLNDKGLTIDYVYDLEKMCHVEVITHLVNSENNFISSNTK